MGIAFRGLLTGIACAEAGRSSICDIVVEYRRECITYTRLTIITAQYSDPLIKLPLFGRAIMRSMYPSVFSLVPTMWSCW